MSSECKSSLPIIDLSNLKQGTPAWQTAKTQVVASLQEIGAFEAKFDEIPRRLGQAVLAGMRDMYDLPLEVKLRNKSREQGTLVECMGIPDVHLAGRVGEFTNLLWPEGNPGLAENLSSLYEKLSQMDKMIRRMVLEGLGLEKHMDDHLDSSAYLLRFQKYDAPTSDEAQVGMQSHTDKNFVTVLYQNEVRGLDVQTKDGRWFTTQPSPNSCIVFVGETYHAWTNGRLYSPTHRVMLKGDQVRYSIALFSSPKKGYIIKAPEELVDEDHPLLFKPFDLHNFVAEPDWASPGAIKKYCGIQTV